MRFFIILALFCGILNAHGLYIFAKQNGDEVFVKSYFSAKSPCRNCDVKIAGKDYKLDEKGEISIKIPSENFEIVVNGGTGHQKKIEFNAKNFNAQNANEQNTNSSHLFYRFC